MTISGPASPALPPDVFRAPPAVYAVGGNYCVTLIPAARCVVWCRVGENTYYDDFNGVFRSERLLHQVYVPAEELEKAESYTVGYRCFAERLSDWNKPTAEGEVTFRFRPVRAENPRFYLISDVHGRKGSGIAAAQAFGKIDFLIVNGDMHGNCMTLESLLMDHFIAAALTGGEIPAVFLRGNHDMRGPWPERAEECIPLDGGKTYFTFRLGPVWGVALDCGEIRVDEHEKHGGVVCCHAMRLRETQWLRELTARGAEEFDAPGVKYRLAVSHVNFTDVLLPPFDIEEELYGQWAGLLREHIRPDCLLFGHQHKNHVTLPGSPRDRFGQSAPAIVAGVPSKTDPLAFSGAGITLSPEFIDADYTDHTGRSIQRVRIPRPVY